ncbi:MAG: phosphoribosylaminoimidazolesuccinocarboxamide synthase [Lachnospiraceae bacterium]|nr:phosphoribosylaminoimidazolesuccinocarboxamide synthase [Lachnospiraceae bacterium]
MQEYTPVKSGKVREIYDVGDNLVIVATDRISCFDVILDNVITDKGKVLTQMSKFWFEKTQDIVPNHMISTDTKDMPEFFRNKDFEGRSMLVRKLTMIPVECIVRGYITGTAWAEYQKSGTVCKRKVAEGLVESEKFPEAIFTPSTKAEIGEHDENVSYEECIEYLEKRFPGKGEQYASKIREYSLAIYNKCADYASEHGIIIADTKFEFGLDENGQIVLGDEVLTPDSSRFWDKDQYEKGRSQLSFDKQFARDWLKNNPGHTWKLPDDVTAGTIEKYLRCYKLLTGRDLQ